MFGSSHGVLSLYMSLNLYKSRQDDSRGWLQVKGDQCVYIFAYFSTNYYTSCYELKFFFFACNRDECIKSHRCMIPCTPRHVIKENKYNYVDKLCTFILEQIIDMLSSFLMIDVLLKKYIVYNDLLMDAPFLSSWVMLRHQYYLSMIVDKVALLLMRMLCLDNYILSYIHCKIKCIETLCKNISNSLLFLTDVL